MTTNIDFKDFESPKAKVFLDKNPELHEIVYRIAALSNECFAKQSPAIKFDAVIFGLGHSARNDFIDICILSFNNRGDSATKILRSLYEKVVTLGYLLNHPLEIEQFIDWHQVTLYKAMQMAFAAGLTKEGWDAAVGEPVEAITSRYEAHKIKYPSTEKKCEVCKKTNFKPSWGPDLVAMAKKVGGALQASLFNAYAIPNLSVHTNIGSAEIIDEEKQKDYSTLSLKQGITLICLVLEMQNSHFNLGLTTPDLQALSTQLGELE